MTWKIIDTQVSSAQENMDTDAKLLSSLGAEQDPILHFYDWEGDCATYGHFTKPESFLNLTAVEELSLNLAKRPTGGGIVFHICDFAFSVLLPASHPSFSLNTLENYAFVNKGVVEAVRLFSGDDITPELLPQEAQPLDPSSRSFCMAKPTIYDVMINGRKVGGAAQRRTKAGFLHQGTISLALLPDDYLEKVLLPGTKVLEAMGMNSYSLLGKSWSSAQLREARAKIKGLLQKTLTETADTNMGIIPSH